MTPKEKAYLLYTTYRFAMADLNVNNDVNNDSIAKQCALISVNEIVLEQCKSSELKNARYQDERLMYWDEVKKEIEKL